MDSKAASSSFRSYFRFCIASCSSWLSIALVIAPRFRGIEGFPLYFAPFHTAVQCSERQNSVVARSGSLRNSFSIARRYFFSCESEGTSPSSSNVSWNRSSTKLPTHQRKSRAWRCLAESQSATVDHFGS